MSIFKESFRNFVRQQIKLREKIISIGNKGADEFKNGRFSSATLDLSNEGGKTITVPEGAFFTNTLGRTCVIRMSSGIDLKDQAAMEIAEGANDPNNPSFEYEKASHIRGDGLARRYVLMGGTATLDRETLKFSDVTTTEKQEPNAFHTGYIEDTRKREESYKFKIGKRSGFRGASPNDFGTAYGDPTIRSNPGDDYGTVPMPGITKVDIATKSAYGSIREAKVEFHCHNQRQLEVLELLYMRPGSPILLEWCWSTYIDNKGKRRTGEDAFPFIGEWWIKEFPVAQIYTKIIRNKVDTGGNYDAILGYVKNYSYKARADGGYDCQIELYATGEILESLKGTDLRVNEGEIVDTWELCLSIIETFSRAVDITTKKNGQERTNVGQFLYGLVQFQSAGEFAGNVAITGGIACVPLVGPAAAVIYNGIRSVFNVRENNRLASGESLFPFFGLDVKGPEPGNPDNTEYYVNVPKEFQPEGDNDRRLQFLKTLVLTEDSKFSSTGESEPPPERTTLEKVSDPFNLVGNITATKEDVINSPFIRWDALCVLLNKFILERTGTGQPIMTFTTNMMTQEDQEEPPSPKAGATPGETGLHFMKYMGTGPTIEPLLYTKMPEFSVPQKDGTSSKVYVKYRAFTGRVKGSIEYHQLLDMSVNPAVCLLPSQLQDYQNINKKGNTNQLWAAPTLYSMTPMGALQKIGNIKELRASQRKYLNDDLANGTGPEANRMIGRIYFNMDRLRIKYKKARYDDETGDRNEDFNLFDFLKSMWDDVNTATGNIHKFTLQLDHERPNICRVVDLQFQKEEKIKASNLHELKIQSNDTICRDFSYDSTIPSALAATIGISMQNPDATTDLDQATFAALAKGIQSRFHVPQEINKEEEAPSEKEIKGKAKEYDTNVSQLKEYFDALYKHRIKMEKGNFQVVGKDGESKKNEKVGSVGEIVERAQTLLLKLKTQYSETKEDQGQYKGFVIPNSPLQISAVIPLKFNAKLDGISGMVIGNVFRVDETRLPRMYKNANVGFICMGEKQTITGGDWITEINGMMTILPPEGSGVGGNSDGGGLGDFADHGGPEGDGTVDNNSNNDNPNPPQNTNINVPSGSNTYENIEEPYDPTKDPNLIDEIILVDENLNEDDNLNKDDSNKDEKSLELDKQDLCEQEGGFWNETTQECEIESDVDAIDMGVKTEFDMDTYMKWKNLLFGWCGALSGQAYYADANLLGHQYEHQEKGVYFFYNRVANTAHRNIMVDRESEMEALSNVSLQKDFIKSLKGWQNSFRKFSLEEFQMYKEELKVEIDVNEVTIQGVDGIERNFKKTHELPGYETSLEDCYKLASYAYGTATKTIDIGGKAYTDYSRAIWKSSVIWETLIFPHTDEGRQRTKPKYGPPEIKKRTNRYFGDMYQGAYDDPTSHNDTNADKILKSKFYRIPWTAYKAALFSYQMGETTMPEWANNDINKWFYFDTSGPTWTSKWPGSAGKLYKNHKGLDPYIMHPNDNRYVLALNPGYGDHNRTAAVGVSGYSGAGWEAAPIGSNHGYRPKYTGNFVEYYEHEERIGETTYNLQVPEFMMVTYGEIK